MREEKKHAGGKWETINFIGVALSSIEKDFTCVICQELFKKAHTLSCSHSFCEQCITDWLKENKNCPTCRKTVKGEPIHTIALDNAISKLVECFPNLAVSDSDSESEQETTSQKTNVSDDDMTNWLSSLNAHLRTVVGCECGGEFYCDIDEYHDIDAYNGLPGVYWGARGFCFKCGKGAQVLYKIT